LPLVFAGPILRRSSPERLVLWLAVREPVRVRITIDAGEASAREIVLEPGETSTCRLLTAGTHLHYLLIDLAFDELLPSDRWIDYAVALQPLTEPSASWRACTDGTHDLCYPGRRLPGFVLPARVGSVLHGSCRKPHHPNQGDGLVEADRLLERCLAAGEGPRDRAGAEAADLDALPAWPSALVLTGDQVYADDVAGPMLHAIHQVVAMLGLPDERLAGGELVKVDSARSLYRHPAGFYRRETLLPRHKRNYALIEVLFGGVEKPVFTTASAHNHLITLGEVLALYLLAWSPALWALIDLDAPPGHLADLQQRGTQRVSAATAGCARPRQSVAVLAALAFELVHPTAEYAGDPTQA
jgi:hypothetical protein